MSVFDPEKQHKDPSLKVVVALERISEAFKVLIWKKAKTLGLSPVQIQILIFLRYHSPRWANTSSLASELNVTKPTISDAVSTLISKELLVKTALPNDGRRFQLNLTEKGVTVIQQIKDYTDPIEAALGEVNDINRLFGDLQQLVLKLSQKGILSVQRTCPTCRFFDHENSHCAFLEKTLASGEIRLDCAEYETAD